MKTSVIVVHDMLSVLSVAGVEKRIGAVPGVESVTVNFAAGNATVRYDETRLQAADIKAAVHQSANESVDEPEPGPESEHKHAGKRAAVPAPEAAPASASTPEAATPKASTAAPAAVPAPTDPAVVSHKNHATQEVKPSAPVAATPKSAGSMPAPAAPAPEAAPDAKAATTVAAKPKAAPDAPPDPAEGGHQDHAASVAKPSTPATAAPKTVAAAPAPATRAIEAAPVVKSSAPDIIDPNAGSWKVNALALATTLGAAYISCAIFDLLFPPFGLLAALAPASPLPISGTPLGFLLGFAMFVVAGLVLGALHGYATQFWRNRFR